MKNKVLSSVLVLLLVCAVLSAGIYGLDSFTAPVIEANNASAAYAPLRAVMPEAQGFEPVYEAGSSESSALSDIPAAVQGIYAESSGLGYALKLSTTEGYTGEPMELSMAVDSEGRICGIQLNSFPDTKEMGADYTAGYLGQDSSLADVGLVSGVTFSCTAFKNAVSDGFSALISNGLVSAGQKSDEQLLMELAALRFPGISNPSGILQLEELESSGSIIKAYKALNGSSYNAILPFGDGSCYAAVNISGDLMAIDPQGNDVTAELDSALAEEVKAEAAGNLSSFAQSDLKRFKRMFSDSAEFTELPLKGVFSSVTTAFSVKDAGQEYTAFAARSYGYSNELMAVYCVLDSEGAIYSLNSPDLILHKEYFDGYTLDEPAYKQGFEGLTSDSFTGEQAFISGATMSTEGMRSAINEIFEAFAVISEDGGTGNE